MNEPPAIVEEHPVIREGRIAYQSGANLETGNPYPEIVGDVTPSPPWQLWRTGWSLAQIAHERLY